ncbi:Gti1/Pac2 family-domain-containing protein [Lentinula raphanica]|nr:Gti1/Pac2 family-domain-containing protein [Lentinula raphanica]
MVRQQRPTLQNVRIRSTLDAHKIFYAVHQGHLEMVTRRLDADERMALGSGCVYAWEERGPHTEITGLGIERFTEGRRWSPSRVRDEFLFYYEKYSPPESAGQASSSEKPQAPKDWDPLVKQTYSVWIETEKGRRKWHLTAYFTQLTVDNLGTIDDYAGVGDLNVPEGMFKSTRVNKSRNKAAEESSASTTRMNDAASGSASASTSASITNRTYAPFPSPYPYPPTTSHPVSMYEPYPAYAQHPQRPQIPEHPPEHNLPYAATPIISSRHVPQPTRTPYQNGHRIVSTEYTHDPSSMTLRVIAGPASSSSYVSPTYNTPGPPDHMYSPVQPLPPPQSTSWYDEHHPQASPGHYPNLSRPEYVEQSPPNSYQSPPPVSLNSSSNRTSSLPQNYTLVNDSSSNIPPPHSPAPPMSPVSPMSPTSPAPVPSMPTPHSSQYQNVYSIPRGVSSYSNPYTMNTAFHSPQNTYMDDRVGTPASPSTESSASGSAGSARSPGSVGSAGSIYGGGGGGTNIPSLLYGPGVPGPSPAPRLGDLRTTTTSITATTSDLVRSAELVRLSEPVNITAGSFAGGPTVAGSLTAGLVDGPQRDLAPLPLPPLHSLKRNHPYRRRPEDDKTLRLLDPRPAPAPVEPEVDRLRRD